MAHAHGITKDDVFAAASSIFGQGKNPTQAAVRAALGSGSFATINKYLSEWRQEHQESEVTVEEGQDIPEEESRLLRRFYWSVRATVEATVNSEQTELLEAENQELRDKLQDYEQVRSELEGLKFAYREAMTRLEELARENERLTKPASKPRTRKPKAEPEPTV